MKRIATIMLLLGLGAAGLSGCYVVSPNAYPAYVPPPAPPPYIPPAARTPSLAPAPPQAAAPPSGEAPIPAPPPQGAPQGSTANCVTVTVEGHYETRVRADGLRATVWVPEHAQQLCQ